MSETTKNYGLIKPAQTDYYNVDDFNGNTDIIDIQLKTNADAISSANKSLTGVKTTADAALPASSFTGAQILAKMAAAGSVLPVANGGTGANTAQTACDNLGVAKMNGSNTYSTFNTYSDLPVGHFHIVYSTLKTDDPFTNTSQKRIDIFVTQSTDNRKMYYVTCVAGGDMGKSFIGYYVSDTGIMTWYEIYTSSDVIPVANGGTGAADLTGFVRTYDGYGNSIFGDNLDNWKTAGTYSAIGNVSATSPSGYTTYNYPPEWTTAGGPWATVMIDAKKDGSGVTQTLWFWNDSSKNLYSRTYYSNTWSSWVKIATSANLALLVQSLLTGGNISVIRQIIKGTVLLPGTFKETVTEISVTISLTNAAKAYVIINGTGNSSGALANSPYLLSLTNTTLTLKNPMPYSDYTVSYQIVEYY